MKKDSTPDLFADLLIEQPPGPPLPPAVPPLPPDDDDGDDSILLHDSAARDYLEYAIAVVKGRALPDVKDGLKPVSYTHLDVYKRQPQGVRSWPLDPTGSGGLLEISEP